jgi:peptidoglycan/xylan/chitin deacetylase (PgdA/CDA1 family)
MGWEQPNQILQGIESARALRRMRIPGLLRNLFILPVPAGRALPSFNLHLPRLFAAFLASPSCIRGIQTLALVMLLVLTYHRIVEKLNAKTDFFDVSAEELDRHLGLVKQAWGKSASLRDLKEMQHHGSNRVGFLITFDDGTVDHYTNAAPVLERNGVHGVFFVNTSRLGAERYLNVQQCQNLKARGHAIESHAHDHENLSCLLPEELHRQLSQSRRVLRTLGLGEWNFLAAPGGSYNESVIQKTCDEGYRFFRTLEWGYNQDLNPLHMESITINRLTAGRWFGTLISPRFETAKKMAYHAKELAKGSSLRGIYLRARDSTRIQSRWTQ